MYKLWNEGIMKLMKEFINKWINEKEINKINEYKKSKNLIKDK